MVLTCHMMPALQERNPEQNALESFANVVGLDLDDYEDRERAEAMMCAEDSDEEIGNEPEETLEDLQDGSKSGSEFDSDGERHINSFDLMISCADTRALPR